MGIGVGILMGGGGDDTDPSAEISQIIEKENPQEANKETKNQEELAEECAEEEKDEEGNCPSGPKKFQKLLLLKKKFLPQRTNFRVTLLRISKVQRSFFRYLLVFQPNMMNKLWLM